MSILSRPLRARGVREAAIARADLLLVCCVHNERLRLPAFLAHYRRLGVAHFLVVDHQSTDGLADELARQPDCSWWRAEGRYKAARFGMDWCNHLLGRYGVGKWCLTVDPDEFLVYPHCDSRDLRALARWLDRRGQPSLYAPLLDAYGPGPLSGTVLAAGQSPFEVCPYFDRFNLSQRFDAAGRRWWVQGGARQRCFHADDPARAPALNKVPLVRWRAGLHYLSSTHHLDHPAFNCTVLDDPAAVSGVLFHFKHVHLLIDKAREELVRGEHYADSHEYRVCAQAGDIVLFDPAISLRYEGPSQLQALGWMQEGGWF